MATVDCPVVVAVIVHRAFAVEEQAVLAVLECKGTIGTEEEGVTVLRMGVSLDTPWLRTAWHITAEQRRRIGCSHVEEIIIKCQMCAEVA